MNTKCGFRFARATGSPPVPLSLQHCLCVCVCGVAVCGYTVQQHTLCDLVFPLTCPSGKVPRLTASKPLFSLHAALWRTGRPLQMTSAVPATQHPAQHPLALWKLWTCWEVCVSVSPSVWCSFTAVSLRLRTFRLFAGCGFTVNVSPLRLRV